MMKAVPTNTVEELYPSFLSAAAARGVREKTLETYKQHFRAISKRLDVSIPIKELRKSDLDDMIFAMRESGLSDRSINSYTRTLKVFFGGNEEFQHEWLLWNDTHPVVHTKQHFYHCRSGQQRHPEVSW